MRVRFVIEAEFTEPPSDYLAQLTEIVQRECRFMFGNSAKVVESAWLDDAGAPRRRFAMHGYIPFIEESDGTWRRATQKDLTEASKEEWDACLAALPDGVVVVGGFFDTHS